MPDVGFLVPTAVITVGLYAGALVFVAAWRARETQSHDGKGLALPPVAVVVAARNEEATIGRCLTALSEQSYPSDRMAIYVADDHSTDRTAAIVAAFLDREDAGPAVRLVDVPEPSENLRGKALAIHAAIGASTEELILMTDADCQPGPGWVDAMVRQLADDAVGVVTAETVVRADDRALLHELQSIDWSFLLAGSGFLIEHGLPITAMGNNMAFRRAAYQRVGGYPALPFSVTEDFLLFKAIVERTRWRARYPRNASLRVDTAPLESLRGVYAQRRRWARGGLRAPLAGWIPLALAYLAQLLPLITLIIAPVPGAALLGGKALAELAMVRAARGAWPRPTAFLAWQGFFMAYVVTLPVALLVVPRINWKGRRL